MTTILKNSQEVDDPRLGRIPFWDPRSNNYLLRQLPSYGAYKLRSYTWHIGVQLDQGQEGACVGFSFGHELACTPVPVMGITNQFARERLYWTFQQNDDWPGGAYPGAVPQYEGTTVHAGAMNLKSRGYYGEVRWADTEEEFAYAIGYYGPGVIGVNWYQGMMNIDTNGILQPTGSIAGGHAILVKGFSYKKGLYRLHNSWGSNWGINGDAYVTRDTMARLRSEQGEFCIPIRRNKKLGFASA